MNASIEEALPQTDMEILRMDSTQPLHGPLPRSSFFWGERGFVQVFPHVEGIANP